MPLWRAPNSTASLLAGVVPVGGVILPSRSPFFFYRILSCVPPRGHIVFSTNCYTKTHFFFPSRVLYIFCSS